MRRALAWLLYGLGCMAEALASGCEWASYRSADAHQWLMRRSIAVQGYGKGPWNYPE